MFLPLYFIAGHFTVVSKLNTNGTKRDQFSINTWYSYSYKLIHTINMLRVKLTLGHCAVCTLLDIVGRYCQILSTLHQIEHILAHAMKLQHQTGDLDQFQRLG